MLKSINNGKNIMHNAAILAILTSAPQNASEIAEKLDRPVSTVRKWLKVLRETADSSNTFSASELRGSWHYAIAAAKVAAVKVIKVTSTLPELLTKVLARSESHLAKMNAASNKAERRIWKSRYLRSHSRALVLAS